MVEINKINLENQRQEPKIGISPKVKVSSGKNNNRKRILFLLLTLVVILAISGIMGMLLVKPLIAQAKTTSGLAKDLYQALKTQDLVAADEKLKLTKESLNTTKKLYYRLEALRYIPVIGSYWSDGDRLLKAADSGLNASEVLIEAITPYADILGFKGKGSFTGGTAEDRIAKMVETLSKIMPKIDEVGNNLKQADEALAQVDPNRYPEKIRGTPIRPQLVTVKNLVHDATLAAVDAKPVLEVLPEVMGYPKTKKYLSLFQNDGELRATGGFITAYGVLRVESGRVRAEKSDDIYSLDKKLNSRIKPPEPIAKYLLSADLKTGVVPYYYLRDMNFSPDFRVSMEDNFLPNYEKIKDESKVDGIIAMDTKVLKDLLGVLGPIDVPGYGKFTLEADKRCFDIPQIICELEYLADVPIPGVKVARKDMLGPLMQELILKAMGTPKSVWPTLFKTIISDISEKHILFYFKDTKAQQAAEIFAAAGRIKSYDEDYLHINDSNFGGAKSNLFVKQEVEKTVTKQADGKLISTLTLTYTNPVPMSNCNLERKTGLCLNGILRDYLRVYVPKGSKLIEGLGSEEKFKTGEELGKTYFDGFFTLRGGGGKAKIVLTYELPTSVAAASEYGLLVQKQPGTEGNHYKIKVSDKEEQEFDLNQDKELKIKL